jgi:hypothetical protein
MNRSTITRTLARGTRLFVVAVLLAGLAMALQPATSAVQAGPTYQPPTNKRSASTTPSRNWTPWAATRPAS